MNLYTIFGILLAIILVNKIVTSIMDFLGIQIEMYYGYLLWFIAILLFYGFLPGPVSYFSNS
jgi:hypothetical protein